MPRIGIRRFGRKAEIFVIAGAPNRNSVIALDALGNIVGRNDITSGFAAQPVIASDGANYLVVGSKVVSNVYQYVAISVTPMGVVRRTNSPAGSRNLIWWGAVDLK